MERTLFILVGAGASYDCASKDYVRSELRPPLVTQLFEPRYARVLDKYPHAQVAASAIRSRSSDSGSIEKFLREQLRDSEHPADMQRFHVLHYYLQDLLVEISREYTRHPDNYDRLVYATERLPSVVYISLNYDTILDERLALHTPGGLRHIDDYCVEGRRWNLVKPHGSVDWVHPIHGLVPNGANDPAWTPPPDLLVDEQQFVWTNSPDVWDRRYFKHDGSLGYFYPAISAPLGSPDTFHCPKEQIEFLTKEIARQDRLDILMLGYSGLDDEVLKLFADAGKPLGLIQAVAGNEQQAQTAMFRLVEAILGHGYGGAPPASANTFSEFVTGPGLGDYLRRRASSA